MNPQIQQLIDRITALETEVDRLKSGNLEIDGFEVVKSRFFETLKAAPTQASLVIGGPGTFAVTANPSGQIVLVFQGKRFWIPYYLPS